MDVERLRTRLAEAGTSRGVALMVGDIVVEGNQVRVDYVGPAGRGVAHTPVSDVDETAMADALLRGIRRLG